MHVTADISTLELKCHYTVLQFCYLTAVYNKILTGWLIDSYFGRCFVEQNALEFSCNLAVCWQAC